MKSIFNLIKIKVQNVFIYLKESRSVKVIRRKGSIQLRMQGIWKTKNKFKKTIIKIEILKHAQSSKFN